MARVNAFSVFLLKQFFEKIPKDLLDAARIDGASEWQVFYIIAVPLCKPILWTVAVFNLIWSWNDYFRPLIYLNDEKLYPVSLGLTYFNQAKPEHRLRHAVAAPDGRGADHNPSRRRPLFLRATQLRQQHHVELAQGINAFHSPQFIRVAIIPNFHNFSALPCHIRLA